MTIQADAAKQDDFETTSDLILTVAPNLNPQQGRLQHIAALKTNKSRQGKIQTGPKTAVEVQFYSRPEWAKLSKEEQDKVRELYQDVLK